MKVPEAVGRLVEGWELNGRSPARPVTWKQGVWNRQFGRNEPEFVFLSSLPDALTRAGGELIGAEAAKSLESSREAFLYSMVWGFGPTNYGAWRTKEILRVNSRPYEALLNCAKSVEADGGIEGYRYLANEGRLKGFGPAFATKYLYFCSVSRPGERALVLDRLVADWLARSAGFVIDPTRWSTKNYEKYLEQMRNWSHSLDLTPEQLEALIFEDERRRNSGQSSD
jgi:hypothetical protein